MPKVTASLPQGTRDFGPAVVRKRQYILTTIRNVFERYGFEPLETPALENLETLMGKYGEEGDKLIFKILNNGLADPKNIDKAKSAFSQVLEGKNDKNFTERALRYDLTIPFARYVAMNHGQLTLPFKRYQIQPVWRADRPQRGRYREFYQCDADIVGSASLLNEAELAHLYQVVFSDLKIPMELRVNNRKILSALATIAGGAGKMTVITTAIDKLDKIGIDKVLEELQQRGLQPQELDTVRHYLSLSGTTDSQLQELDQLLGHTGDGKQGIAELRTLLDYLSLLGQVPVLDPTLARGLNYYTGTIFEVKATSVSMGSIGGGGRYDDLTGLFGVPGIPGVGISFGVDRIYDVLEELQLFPATIDTGTLALFLNLGESESREAFKLVDQLRTAGVNSELYPEAHKIDKQYKYAERKNIPFVISIGPKEVDTRQCLVKNIRTGQQLAVPFSDLIHFSFKPTT